MLKRRPPSAFCAASAIGSSERLSAASRVTAWVTISACSASTAVCTLYPGAIVPATLTRPAFGSGCRFSLSSAACTAAGSMLACCSSSAFSMLSRYFSSALRARTLSALATARHFVPAAGDPLAPDQATASCQLHQFHPCRRHRFAVQPPELRDRLVVRIQPPQQPHQLHVAPTLCLQPPRRTDRVQIAIQVKLQQIARIVAGAARLRRLRPPQAQ